MDLVSIATVCALTGISERTLWRRISEGALVRHGTEARALLDLEAFAAQLPACAERALVVRADRGDAEAANELAIVFLEAGRDADAVYWLQRSADAGNADSMQMLANCFLRGAGVPQDAALALMWLGRAAHMGHAIAQAQIAAITRLRS